MEPISLNCQTAKNQLLSATFLPTLGMNLISFKKDSLEVIDQSTKEAFSQRFSGLGPLIGPHFFRMEENLIVKPLKTKLFPHIKEVLKRGQKDPFSHGIGRYVPWNYKKEGESIEASLSGNDKFQGIFLKDLEGYDFHLRFLAELKEDGLSIFMSSSAEKECVCGLHYYYLLENAQGSISSPIQPLYNNMGKFLPVPDNWLDHDRNLLRLDLKEFVDYGFLPLFEQSSSWVVLSTGNRKLRVSYRGEVEKISCQIYSPKGASFVCIEPISAKNPRNLDYTENQFHAKISIL